MRITRLFHRRNQQRGRTDKIRQIVVPATALTIGITGTASLVETNVKCKKLIRQLDRTTLIGQCKVISECFIGGAIGIYAAQHFGMVNLMKSWSILATRNFISPWTSWFTSTLLHGGLFHLLFNMMALSSFERGFNTLHLIETFTLGAVWSGACAAFFATTMKPTIGASGAIIGTF